MPNIFSKPWSRRHLKAGGLLLVGLLTACASDQSAESVGKDNKKDADKLYIIDCLLPGQVRKLGAQQTYQTARRPIKTTASECEIRGGEYVAYDRADYATSLKVWMPLAQEGDAEAQNYMGQIFEKGMGLPPDYAMAALWYQKAADQGFQQAMINLGSLYEKGLGVPRDPIMALNLYRKATGVGDDKLQYSSAVAVAEASQEEIKSLQQQLAVQQAESARMGAKLDEMKRSLAAKESEIKLARQEQKRKEQALADAKGSQAEALKADLLAYEQTLQSKEKEAAVLKQGARGLEDKLASANSANVNEGGYGVLPVIEIIDPPMNVTRGVRAATLRPEVKEVEVIGKINAPAGLKNFVVNGKPYTPDEFDLFWVKLPIQKEVTPVTISAMDAKGHRVQFGFSLYSDRMQAARTAMGRPLVSAEGVALGRYHALVIGNDDYVNLPTLKTAVNDAKATAAILQSKYGFKTRVLTNASRYDILSALNEYRETLTDQDNLLIYYAGHGELDSVNNRGYWLPVDAEKNNNANWISNVAVTDIINAMKARHIMVIADSCYSGTLSRATLTRVGNEAPVGMQKEWVEMMASVRARTVLTSGGIQPVLDVGGGEHSVFAQALLAALDDNEGLIEGYSLYLDVMRRLRVALARVNQEQSPEYAPIQHAGHEAGEFLFQPLKSS